MLLTATVLLWTLLAGFTPLPVRFTGVTRGAVLPVAAAVGADAVAEAVDEEVVTVDLMLRRTLPTAAAAGAVVTD